MNSRSGNSTKNGSSASPAGGLVVLVWTRNVTDAVDPDWVRGIRSQLSVPVYSVASGVSGLRAAGSNHKDWDGALRSLEKEHPGSAVLMLRAGVGLPKPVSILDRLLSTQDLPDITTFPGNFSDTDNPFSAWPEQSAPEQPARLAYWCSDALWEKVAAPREPDCLLIAPGLARQGSAVLKSDSCGLIDEAFAFDSELPLLPGIGPDADSTALPLGQLRLRLRQLALSGASAAAGADPDRPVTLHIAHSWGGGVWRWIEDFITGDDGVNLVLISDSDPSGEICGRGLKLFVGGIGRGLIREIPLAPHIESTVGSHSQYRKLLGRIIDRFGVGRVMISSLIGHSLDCLATGLPTVQVLHDFYPVWPLLDFDPLPFIDKNGGVARTAAFARYGDTLRMGPHSPGFWKRIADAWRRAIESNDVQLVAPADHVIHRWQMLNPGSSLKIVKIPHAFRPFSDKRKALRPNSGDPLHLVIPGRLTQGKGLELIEQALPHLQSLVRITALGCGREAFRLFGHAGIDLICDYRHEEFPSLIRKLKPHAALFLSTVPETWNFALSEVRSLGLVPIATRVGSFPERIRDHEDGLLFEPSAEALVDMVKAICNNPGTLDGLAPKGRAQQTPVRLVSRFNALIPCQTGTRAALQPVDESDVVLGQLANDLVELEVRYVRVVEDRNLLGKELDARTRWAEKLDRQFRERSKWIESLRSDLDTARNAYATLQLEFEARSEWSKSLDRELQSAHESYAKLQGELEAKAAWALELDAALESTRAKMSDLTAEFEERSEWALRLDREKKELETVLGHEIERFRTELERERDSRLTTEARLAEVASRLERVEAEFSKMLGSRSWRITRPLRVGARLGRNALQRGAFNPLRWPHLAGRFFHHWKLRGARQALVLLQSPPISAAEHVSVRPQAVPESGKIADPVVFHTVEQPKVSVIVPVYNQLHFTAACLQSLVSVRNRIDFEIIVIDDCSSDGTRAWCKLCRGIRVLKNRKNLGFIRTCNRGAIAAEGHWLVFLNNDTQVTDNWLDTLIETFADRPSAGIVGGRLVFGDGTLQEAGGIIFRDASGWNYGRGEDPDRPDFNFLSETDYVSGACLAIERQLFAELGGFDTYYAPAYYEDTDLCFRVRERGLKVFYQPASTVIHFEGGTSGTDESTGIKQHQAVNRDKFLARWGEMLRQYPENPQCYTSTVAREIRYRRFSRRALVVDATTPLPDHDSGSVRMFALLRLLDELGYQTTFMPENLHWVGRHSSDLQKAGIEVLTSPWVQDPETWLSEHGAELELIIVSRHYVLNPMLKMLRVLCPNAKLIFDTVDLHFLREQREAELSGMASISIAAEKTRKQELALIEATDATLVVSQFEKDLLHSLLPQANVSVVSNIHTLRDPGKPFEARHDLVFVGGFQHPPNLDAANWLIDEIMPLVLSELPGVTLHVIGSRMPESLQQRQTSGIKLHGFVGDIDPYMKGCRISLAPLRYGAGVKGKVNQAMSYGLPVVATSCAAEGMYTEHGVDILMADDASQFAAEIIRLYQDPELWEALAENGRLNVERHFSVAAARQAVIGTLESVGLTISADGEPN
ncbi:MAG TPA: glycosyltransferase [Wenzhouxiangellaceae bacterium]|nr:glycosyltransferase [Wenzhouxiangellaceae bacterium]